MVLLSVEKMPDPDNSPDVATAALAGNVAMDGEIAISRTCIAILILSFTMDLRNVTIQKSAINQSTEESYPLFKIRQRLYQVRIGHHLGSFIGKKVKSGSEGDILDDLPLVYFTNKVNQS